MKKPYATLLEIELINTLKALKEKNRLGRHKSINNLIENAVTKEADRLEKAADKLQQSIA